MGLIGRLKVVVVKSTIKARKHEDGEDLRFRKPGRMDRSIENGKDYRSIIYDEERTVDDLLPVKEKKLETSKLTKQLDYVLILNFGEPIAKS
jgi:hypothetical protein